MSVILCVTTVALALRLGTQALLTWLNIREVSRRRQSIPAALDGVMDPGTYAKSADYSLAKLRFGQWENLWETAVLAVVLFSGVLPEAWAMWTGWLGTGAWAGAGFLVAVLLGLGLPSLPWEWWAQFRLEDRFGFNRSTQRLWILDRIKGTLLGIALGTPVLWLLIVVVEGTGPLWWLWAWITLTGVKLLLAVIVPWWIMPLFNKFTPLADAALRDRLMALADRGRFQARSIHVMDGSKRSAHSNALFTGFGRFRRIVLFDTLIAQLGVEELEAVLAHEIGHYRRGHIWKGLLVGAVLTLGGFLLLGWLMATPAFFAAFGFSGPATPVAFLLFGLLSGVFGFWFTPLGNMLSRKHEYEADAFAHDLVGAAAPLVRALKGLARENLSNLTPHPAYSAFYYSHPTLVERVAALEKGRVGSPAAAGR
ncbi:MAG: M48 family metallopeptidase [Opitutaceae bacterium]|nr:M48 family metallopeptidase [Opitutaceae bacterium]